MWQRFIQSRKNFKRYVLSAPPKWELQEYIAAYLKRERR